MEILSSSSSLSLRSSDSLRDAFASLDAASAEKRDNYLDDSYSNQFDASPHPSALFTAQKQQWQSSRSRVLCGGVALKKMKKVVEDRAASSNRSSAHYSLQQPTLRDMSEQDNGPTFEGFPLSLESEHEEEEEEEEEEGELEERVPSCSASAMASVISEPAEPSSQKRKRTLQWAAKRDRRIARRRQAPPLTRGQLRQQQERGEEVESRVEMMESVPLSGSSRNETAEVTDPSLGSESVETDNQARNPSSRKSRANSKKRKVAPMLDLTFTEPLASSAAAEEEKEIEREEASPESSQTESDVTDGRSARIVNRKKPSLLPNPTRKKGEESIESSETEEEERDGQREVWLPRQPQETQPAAKSAEKRQARSKKAEKLAKTSTRRATNIPTTKEAKESITVRGSPIFQDSSFMVLGFWAKVKLFEGLVSENERLMCLVTMANEEDADSETWRSSHQGEDI